MTDLFAPPDEEVSMPIQPATPPTEPEIPTLARVLGAVGRGMILAGIVVLLFVVFQLWGTDIQEARAQDDLRDDLTARFDTVAAGFDPSLLVAPAITEPDPTGDDEQPTTSEAGSNDADVPVTELAEPEVPEVDDELLALLFPEDGDALARIEIPSIEVDKVVVRGVAVADLRKGPGHYSQTSLPGNPGNSSIAGHRTTYGSPFNRIDELNPGDEITITSIQGDFTYRVLDPTLAYPDELGLVDEVGPGHIIVDPGATWVLGDFGDDRLTLTACHPKLSSRQRIIVAAELVEDAVELPEWALEAEATRQADAEGSLGADGTSDTASPDDDPVLAEDGDDPDASMTDSTDVAAPEREAPDLDEGLNGERDAIPPAAAWMLAAVVLWWAGGRLGARFGARRWQRIGLRFVGLVPAAVCLWFSFELIDRALPAG